MFKNKKKKELPYQKQNQKIKKNQKLKSYFFKFF